MVTNQSKRYLFRDFHFGPVLNAWVRKAFDLPEFNQTHNALIFSPSAKYLLHRYVSPSLTGHSFRVDAG